MLLEFLWSIDTIGMMLQMKKDTEDGQEKEAITKVEFAPYYFNAKNLLIQA